jgi:molybdopterin-guanine dinucleotide biosynthesis protein MobB
MDVSNFSYVILAGGESRRMRQDKAKLKYRGVSFLRTLVNKGVHAGFDDILISGHDATVQKTKNVPDVFPKRGPLGGFHACFQASNRRYCLVVSVDVPQITPNTLLALADYHIRTGKRATILRDKGQVEPLIGVYDSDLFPLIEGIIQDESASVWRLLDNIDFALFPYAGEVSLRSVNTMKDYEALFAEENAEDEGSHSPLLLAIGGGKNVGKTTLITRLIPLIQERGFRVATLKHHHKGDIEVDIPGKDTYRHREAGAYATALYSPTGFMVYKREPLVTPEKLVSFLPEADIVLLEGFHLSSYRKIEVIRGEKGREPITNRENRLALATDIPDLETDELKLPLNKSELIADFICSLILQRPKPIATPYSTRQVSD